MVPVMAGPELTRLFDDYAAYHTHPANKAAHFIGVPLIVFTVVGLLTRVPIGPVSLAVPVAAAVILYDVRLSVKLTLPFVAFVALSFWAAPALRNWVLWAGFLGGWALQFIGHYAYEKKSPAFFKNLQQLLIGPLWLLEEATQPFRRRGLIQS